MPDTANLDRTEAPRVGAIRVAGLDHLVLRVADLDRAIKFYGDVLGCHVERRLEEPKLVQLRAGASMIDLVPAGSAAQAVEARNLDHFAVVTRDDGAEPHDSSLYINHPDGNVAGRKGLPEKAE